MDGVLIQVRVEVGQQVEQGETLAILEAMKMEVILPAPFAGTVTAIASSAGAPVSKGQLLIALG
jgi:biotin carboxyl carrier protein